VTTKACVRTESRFIPPGARLSRVTWQPHGSGTSVKTDFRFADWRLVPGVPADGSLARATRRQDDARGPVRDGGPRATPPGSRSPPRVARATRPGRRQRRRGRPRPTPRWCSVALALLTIAATDCATPSRSTRRLDQGATRDRLAGRRAPGGTHRGHLTGRRSPAHGRASRQVTTR
jgi:hypothetical protein